MKKILLLLALAATPCFAKPHRHETAQHPPSVLLYNITDHRPIVYRNSEQQRPLASITKLMTAMVTLDREHNLNKIVRFRGNDVPLSTVMTFLLVRSDNEAAEFLARSYAGGRQQFINMMNVKSRELGMTRTWFDDPSGRSSNNVSTVDDINTMVQKAATYKFITDISSQPQQSVELPVKKRKKIRIEEVTLRNTNFRLLFEFDTAILSKTGFTNAAGRCLAMMVERDGKRYSVVVLGTNSIDQRARTVEDLILNYTEKP